VTFDEQVRAALDHLLNGVKGRLDGDLRAFAEGLTRAAAVEQERAARRAADAAADEVRRQAQAQLAELRGVAKKQTDELRRTADTQIAELKRILEHVRRTAEQQVEETKRTAEAEVAAARDKATGEIEDARRVAHGQVEDVQRTMDERIAEVRKELQDTRRELEASRRHVEEVRKTSAAAAEELVIAQLAIAHAENEEKIAEAVERARTDSHQSELAIAARLVDAIRSLDEARSLGEVLDGLAQFAAREVDRAAVLIVKEDGLHGWRMTGFAAAPAQVKQLTMTLDESGLPGAVVRAGVAVSRPAVSPAQAGDRQPALPPFATDAGVRHALALPVTVDSAVVAVLYADAPRLDTPSASSRWPAVLEVLTRHASRALEALTVQQAAGLSLPRPVARASHSTLPGPVEHAGGDDTEDVARRYARLLLSEVRMFNEPVIDAGRRSRDLLARLGGEIDRARKLYEARVPPTVSRRGEFFYLALARTIADGDRPLLGSILCAVNDRCRATRRFSPPSRSRSPSPRATAPARRTASATRLRGAACSCCRRRIHRFLPGRHSTGSGPTPPTRAVRAAAAGPRPRSASRAPSG
jgi:hypothetical protein